MGCGVEEKRERGSEKAVIFTTHLFPNLWSDGKRKMANISCTTSTYAEGTDEIFWQE